MVEHQPVELVGAGSIPVGHPKNLHMEDPTKSHTGHETTDHHEAQHAVSEETSSPVHLAISKYT